MGRKPFVRDRLYSCPFCKKMGGVLIAKKPDHEVWRCTKCARDTSKILETPAPLGGSFKKPGDGPACLRYGRISHSSERSMAKTKQDEATLGHWESNLKPKGYRDGGFWFDEDVSAAVVPFLDRKYARDLYENARPGDVIVAQFGTRTFRSLLDMGLTLERLAQRGISLQLMDFQIDLSTTIGRILGGFFIAFGEMEVEFMRERMVNDKEAKIRAGKPHGKNATMGWKVATVAGEKAYVPDEEQRAACLWVVQQREKGKQLIDLAAELGRHHMTVLKMERAARNNFPHPADVYKSEKYQKLREKNRLKKRLRRGQAFLNSGNSNPML